MKTIATWYYEQDDVEGGIYPQVPLESHSEAFRDVYRRCVAVFFACARAANRDARLVLYTNRSWRTDSSNVADLTRRMMEELGVEVLVADYESAPPTTWPQAWRNQFYVLDVLRAEALRQGPLDQFVLLDSDVVWTSAGAAESFWAGLELHGCLTYDLGFPFGMKENGLDAYDLSAIFKSLTSVDVEPLSYVGGELQAATGEVLSGLSRALDEMWDLSLRAWSRGEQSVREEAHLLTLAYRTVDVPPGEANKFIKRCWTQRLSHTNLDGTERSLALWHVPAEKRFGIARLYSELADMGAEVWIATVGDDLCSHLGEKLGVPKPSAGKLVRDLTVRLRERSSGFTRRTT